MPANIELLAPGGDVDSIKAAIAAGADAVYCGLGRFNARNRAENISYNQLQGILHLAHSKGCKVFLTLNIIVVEPELATFAALLNKLCNTSIDGIILQDVGMLYLVKKYFPSIAVHASTQLTTHNPGQIDFLHRLGVQRVNLSRELNINEIQELTKRAHQKKMMTEVFVHGSHCLSFSGLCYMSSVLEGKSGNRGRCSQPCRDQYQKTKTNKDFPLNLKDNSAYLDIESLVEAEVDCLKIEGRIKKFHYVYTVVKSYRNQLQKYYDRKPASSTDPLLYKVFNRQFTSGYLRGNIHRNMFIDNPRDNSAHHLAKSLLGSDKQRLEKAKSQLYHEKTAIISDVADTISRMSTEKVPVTISMAGKEGEYLAINIGAGNISSQLLSETVLQRGAEGENTLNAVNLEKLFQSLGDTEYVVDEISLTQLEPQLQLPFKELTRIKRAIFSLLHRGREYIPPINLPRLQNKKSTLVPSLSVLISSEKDLHLCSDKYTVYFELPSCLPEDYSELLSMFQREKRLLPWFPAVIIGEDFERAVRLLGEIRPDSIVTNNSGIAFEAFRRSIPWLAGPHLNITNSYSLLSLKKEFGCTGAFISNELNNYQIKTIKKPANFSLHYSIYHPISLMTCRQCLNYQVSGCHKDCLDNDCLSHCEKNSTITTLQDRSLFIDKRKGHYHTVYNSRNFLGLEIVRDINNMFDSFLVDLRSIKTKTRISGDKREIANCFLDFLQDKEHKAEHLKANISQTSNNQYQKGI